MGRIQDGINLAGYVFDGPFDSTGDLRSVPGIYAILDQLEQGWHVVDVGESETVQDRVHAHDRAPCWTRARRGRLGVAVLYLPGSSAPQRRFVEQAVRAAYRPSCGQQ